METLQPSKNAPKLKSNCGKEETNCCGRRWRAQSIGKQLKEENGKGNSIEKITNLPKPNEAGPSTSCPRQTQPGENRIETEAETEIMSSESENTIAVLTIFFKRNLGDISVRYINMRQASKTHDNPIWNLEETDGPVEQKFATGLETITGETTNDKKLLKPEDEYKVHQKQLSTRFYDDKFKKNPSITIRTVITLLQ